MFEPKFSEVRLPNTSPADGDEDDEDTPSHEPVILLVLPPPSPDESFVLPPAPPLVKKFWGSSLIRLLAKLIFLILTRLDNENGTVDILFSLRSKSVSASKWAIADGSFDRRLLLRYNLTRDGKMDNPVLLLPFLVEPGGPAMDGAEKESGNTSNGCWAGGRVGCSASCCKPSLFASALTLCCFFC